MLAASLLFVSPKGVFLLFQRAAPFLSLVTSRKWCTPNGSVRLLTDQSQGQTEGDAMMDSDDEKYNFDAYFQ